MSTKKRAAKKSAKKNTKKSGRPAGSQSKERSFARVDPSRCRACDSTERRPYIGSPIVCEFAGEFAGKSYTHVVRRRTACKNCGQHRIDVFYENRPKQRPKLARKEKAKQKKGNTS